MTAPSIRGTNPPPLPNEVIALVMVAGVACGVGYMFWRIQRDGIAAFRRSSLFSIAPSLALGAYYAAYAGINAGW